MLDYNDLLALFPPCGGPTAFPFELQSPDFCYIAEPNPCFISPTFRLQGEQALGISPSVVLISAPAAMGKSAVARALAHDLQAPLWNLAKFTLGEGTFTGIPRRQFGGNQFNDIETNLRAGSFLYVLDALDEARARPGHGFESFLLDVCEEGKHHRPRPSMILLGRTEASSWAALYLEEYGVPFVHYSIDFFNRNKSEEFIDKYLDQIAINEGQQAYHRIQRDNFVNARNELFSRVCEVLGSEAAGDEADWTDARTREFAGYAPVLEVLSDFLDDGNYFRLQQQMSSLGGNLDLVEPQHAAWKFLRDIVSGLLSREQEKLLNPLKDEIEQEARSANWEDWGKLYTGDEQCERVLCHSFKLPAPVLPEDVPPKVRVAYTKAIEISDHAFVKDEVEFTNVVFRDFLYAWSLRRGSKSVKDAVELRLVEESYKTSPLLAHFYLTPDEGKETEEVSAEYLGYIYESLLSKESLSDEVLFMLDWNEDGAMSAAFGFGDAASADFSFAVVESGGTMNFPRFLRDAEIEFPGRIGLGRTGSHFDLGPAVRISCAEFCTSATQIRVAVAAGEASDVIIEADEYSSDSAILPEIVVKGNVQDGALLVEWPNIAYPWDQFQFNFPARANDPRIKEAANRFISILAPFRGRRFGGLARARALIDNRPVGRKPMGRAMREQLLKEGILRVDGRLYTLDLERLGELGVTWHTMSRREIPDGLVDVLNDFLAQNPAV